MKTRYKITVVVLLIIGISVSSIMTIDHVYANTHTPQFIVVSKAFCPYFPIPDDFVANQVFFAVYHTDPVKQLDMIHYAFYSVCYKEIEDSTPDLDSEHDSSNSKGCPQFCPKDKGPEDDLNFSKLIRNEENRYCDSTHDVQHDQCYSLEDIVFGNARKSWTIYPGGSGWQIPKNSTLEPIYKEIHIGMSSLNFTAMLDDKIFVDKCELNGGMWNYTYHDCEGLWEICHDVDGITVSENITPPCIDAGIVVDDPLTIKACRGAETIRVSCVFEYEN